VIAAIPNSLTWARVVAIPLLVALYWLPITAELRDGLATGLFVVAALTDWLDGWLARRWGVVTAFGAFLDPVADKLIVAAALVMLLSLDRAQPWVGFVIIGREIAISALREWMAELGQRRSVTVHWVGKLKTVAQLVAIPMLLWGRPLLGVDMLLLGNWLVIVAALLTIWSMFYYLNQAWPHLRGAMDPPKPAEMDPQIPVAVHPAKPAGEGPPVFSAIDLHTSAALDSLKPVAAEPSKPGAVSFPKSEAIAPSGATRDG
jgi:CDP-diacylglycerol--glycerol-3-phosphate 3-phosphatidyltransferase/cardiolipin synthase